MTRCFIGPIASASRERSTAQKMYLTCDTEELGTIFGVTEFQHYLYEHKFDLHTNERELKRFFVKRHLHRFLIQISDQ